MKYLLFIKHSEGARALSIPQALNDAMGPFFGDLTASGKVVDTAGLKPTSEASVVTSSGGKLTVTDGPFAESKEIIGGYVLIDVPTRDEAISIATEFMELHRLHWPDFEFSCEVRQVEA